MRSEASIYLLFLLGLKIMSFAQSISINLKCSVYCYVYLWLKLFYSMCCKHYYHPGRPASFAPPISPLEVGLESGDQGAAPPARVFRSLDSCPASVSSRERL